MDLVNSVTQNSNNRNVTMENQGDEGDRDHDNNGRNRSNSNNSYENHQATTQEMSATTLAAEQNESGAAEYVAAPLAANLNDANISSSSSSSGGGNSKLDDEAKQASGGGGGGSSNTHVPDYLRAIGMDPRKFWPKKYRFTREKPPGQHNPLTIAQRNFYESNGYIVFDECASRKLLDSIRSQYKLSGELANEFLLDKLLIKNNKLLQYVKCFCDDSLMLMTHRLIDNFQTNELAMRDVIDNGQQQRQLLFRDWMYLPFRPIDKVCCAITAIEPLDHVLLVVPGTHRVGQCSISSTLDNVSAAYDSSQEKNYQTREIFECSPERLSSLVDKSKRGFKYINLKPGQTLFYHPGLIHGFSNDLVNFRKPQLVSIAYYAAADCEYIDLRKSAPGLLSSSSSSSSNQQPEDGANFNPDQQQQQQQQQLVPISLAHFGPDKSPIDYTSWLGRPRLVTNIKAVL